jgi:hypothetical protein
MKRNVIFGMILAAGLLRATAVRAQDNQAANDAAATQEQSATTDNATQAKNYKNPTTVDADGNEVAKPNPTSDFMKRARALDGTPVEMPLVDDFRTDGLTPDGHGVPADAQTN